MLLVGISLLKGSLAYLFIMKTLMFIKIMIMYYSHCFISSITWHLVFPCSAVCMDGAEMNLPLCVVVLMKGSVVFNTSLTFVIWRLCSIIFFARSWPRAGGKYSTKQNVGSAAGCGDGRTLWSHNSQPTMQLYCSWYSGCFCLCSYVSVGCGWLCMVSVHWQHPT